MSGLVDAIVEGVGVVVGREVVREARQTTMRHDRIVVARELLVACGRHAGMSYQWIADELLCGGIGPKRSHSVAITTARRVLAMRERPIGWRWGDLGGPRYREAIRAALNIAAGVAPEAFAGIMRDESEWTVARVVRAEPKARPGSRTSAA